MISLARNHHHVPIEQALAYLSAQYELHLTKIVLVELDRSRYGNSPTLENWIKHSNQFERHGTPVTQALMDGRALTKNGGEYSILEWNTTQPHRATLASDDGFFNRLDANHGDVKSFINDRTAPVYQEYQHRMSEIFVHESLTPRTHSAEFNATLFKNSQISDSAFANSLKTLEPRVVGLRGQTEVLLEQVRTALADESSALQLDRFSGAAAVRALSTGLTAAGLGLAAYDMVTSTEKALAQLRSGDSAGALATESALAGRLAGGFWGAGIGAEVGLALGATLFGAGAITAAGLGAIAGGLAGAPAGALAGDALMSAAVALGEMLGGALGAGLQSVLSGPLGAALAGLLSPLAPFLRDPLVLDLDGDGIELIRLVDSQVHFDFDHDGFAERSGWVAADDGLLAIDADGNGRIDGIQELFGSPSEDGFDALARLDRQLDGRIDVADADFAALRVWRDRNGDGTAGADEVQSLSEAGIVSLSLSTTDIAGQLAGHDRGFGAHYLLADGTQRAAETIYFQTNRMQTRSALPADTTLAPGTEQLPRLPGYGRLRPSEQALALSPALLQAWTHLADQASKMGAAAFDAAFDRLLLQWAAADSVVAGSRGAHIDARHLAVVETFFGDSFRELNRQGQVHSLQPSNRYSAEPIEASYLQIKNLLQLSFLSQVDASAWARHSSFDAASPFFLTSCSTKRPTAPRPRPAIWMRCSNWPRR